jgi:hypothetical protein
VAKLKTEIRRAGRLWAVHVDTPGGVRLEYRYGSESQARFFAAGFDLGPDIVPPALRATPTPGGEGPSGCAARATVAAYPARVAH